ncbi:MAG: hypothetical protein WDW38_009691 [Sanguina aurantia]
MPPSALQGSSSGGQPALLRFLDKIKLPLWLVGILRPIVSFVAQWNPNILRGLALMIGFISLSFGREMMVPSNRIVPEEVMYSQFVKSLSEERVQSARLEHGTGKLYYVLKPSGTAAAAAAVAAAESASAASAVPVAVQSSGLPSLISNPASDTSTTIIAITAAASSSSSSSSAPSGSAAATASPAEAAVAAVAATATAAATQAAAQTHRFIKLADTTDPALIQKIIQAAVPFYVFKASFSSQLQSIFLATLTVWLPLVPLFLIMRKVLDQRQGTSTRAKKPSSSSTPTITFADVAGVDSAKRELMEVVSTMKATRPASSKLKVKMPSGVLLCGPPGTGKTLLGVDSAKRELMEVVSTMKATRPTSSKLKSAPCVIFVDELDAVGARRGMGFNDERDQTLNQLLTELDGFEGRAGVLFLAATNRIDVLDPALLRPGRINRKVVVSLPDEGGRRDILAVHLRGVPMATEDDKLFASAQIARIADGFSGAELANVVNEASLLAARKDAEEVTLVDLLEGLQRTKFGVDGRTGGATTSGVGGQVQKWLLDRAKETALLSADQRRVKVSSGSPREHTGVSLSSGAQLSSSSRRRVEREGGCRVLCTGSATPASGLFVPCPGASVWFGGQSGPTVRGVGAFLRALSPSQCCGPHTRLLSRPVSRLTAADQGSEERVSGSFIRGVGWRRSFEQALSSHACVLSLSLQPVVA